MIDQSRVANPNSVIYFSKQSRAPDCPLGNPLFPLSEKCRIISCPWLSPDGQSRTVSSCTEENDEKLRPNQGPLSAIRQCQRCWLFGLNTSPSVDQSKRRRLRVTKWKFAHRHPRRFGDAAQRMGDAAPQVGRRQTEGRRRRPPRRRPPR